MERTLSDETFRQTIYKEMSDLRNELKICKEQNKLYKMYIRETYQYLDYITWKQHKELEITRIEEPERCQTPELPYDI